MKTSKLFTIDVEIAERLKNMNGSELTNRLLKEYFELRSDKSTLKDEKTAILKQLSKKKSNFLKKLRLLMNGILMALITLRRHGLKHGRIILRAEKYFPILTEEALKHLSKHLQQHAASTKKIIQSSNDK